MKIERLLCVPILLLLLGFLFQLNAIALGPPYSISYERNLAFIIAKKPPVKFGGTSLETGIDCSYFKYLAAKWSGMPVKRTTSRRMALGLDGWNSIVVPSNSRQHLDLAFWTFKPSRPNGHVGSFWKHKDQITHASYGRNQVVVCKFSPYFQKRLTKVRRLTFGDRK